MIRKKVTENEIKLREDDTAVISQAYFDSIIESCRKKFSKGWSKEYREMGSMKLAKEVMEYMKGYSMIQTDKNTRQIEIMPLCGKISAIYPYDFE